MMNSDDEDAADDNGFRLSIYVWQVYLTDRSKCSC